MSQPIRLGFIGASASGGSRGEGSWAIKAHIPYLKSSRNGNLYKITALQNSSKEAAEKAAKDFKLDNDIACYGDHQAIASDSNVDLVAVSVKVPNHYDAIMPALNAGKDVFVEWPLARNLSEAEIMVKLAQAKNLKTMVGLQARQSPSILAAKKLIDSGAIGDIIGTYMHGYGITSGEAYMETFMYGAPIEAGANLLTIAFGHAVDAMCYVLGELEWISATLTNRRPEFDIVDGKGNVLRRGSKTAHDYISISGPLVKSGGVATVIYQGGMNPTGGPGFTWQIDGTKGCIRLEGKTGHVQMYQPKIQVIYKGDKEMKDVEGVEWVGEDFSYAVGKAWQGFAGDKDGGSVTTFEDALLRHKMIDAIYRSNEKGTRESYI